MAGIIKAYFSTFAVFMVIDLIWLGFIAKNLYSKYLGYIMKTDINWWAAIIFYLLFIIGLLFFVLFPALERSSWSYALLVGAFYGLITYATYDLTNLATIKDWPVIITIVDLIWGSILSGLTAFISYHIIVKII